VDFDNFQDGVRSATVRFQTACSEDVPSLDTYSGLLYASAGATPLVGNLEVSQTRQGRVPASFISDLLGRDQVSEFSVQTVGVLGHSWLTAATVYKIDVTGRKTVWANLASENSQVFAPWVNPSARMLQSIIVTPTSEVQNPADQMLRAGEFLQWTCDYANTITPVFPPLIADLPVPDRIEEGTSYQDYACDIFIIFTNSRCGGAYVDPTVTTPPECGDPLFVNTTQPIPDRKTHLVYDYRPSGECSNGGQWLLHPYHCTKQYDGGKCAYCTGRANNKQVHTCIERNGMACNAMFNTLERKSWCNMEFECPASVPFVSLVAVVGVVLAVLF